MTSSTATVWQRRRPLRLALAACVVLLGCILFACIANAFYWSSRQGGNPPVTADMILAEMALLPAGNAGAGEQLFRGAGTCSACHALDSAGPVVGPSLAELSARAAARQPDYTAEMHLYESIVYPNAFVVEGFQAGIMPTHYGQQLSRQQLADLVAFLLAE